MPGFLSRTIFILLLILIAVPTDAQISLGFNAGTTRMKLTGDSPSGIGYFAPRLGFMSGLSFQYRFDNGVAARIEPGIDILRSKYIVLNDSGTRSVDSSYMSMHSFALPIHAIVWSKNGRFYVLAGFQVNRILNFKGETLKSPFSESENRYDVVDFYFYAQFGAGFIISLGRPYLNFEVRYSQGLNDLQKPLVHQSSFLPRTKLTNLNFIIGLNIPLGNSGIYQIKKPGS